MSRCAMPQLPLGDDSARLVVRNTFLEVETVEEEATRKRNTIRRCSAEAVFFRRSTRSIETSIDSDSDPEHVASPFSSRADASGPASTEQGINYNDGRVKNGANGDIRDAAQAAASASSEQSIHCHEERVDKRESNCILHTQPLGAGVHGERKLQTDIDAFGQGTYVSPRRGQDATTIVDSRGPPSAVDGQLIHVIDPASPAASDANRFSPRCSTSQRMWAGAKFLSTPKVEQDYTTVMLRNLPNDYTRNMLMGLLLSQGFEKCYDFIYVPFDFKKQAGLGYAFVNFINHEAAVRAMTELPGFRKWKSKKVLQVSWSTPLQGLRANLERHRNSPVMHPDVPEKFKPLVLVNGSSVPFPPPTKMLQPPVSS